MTSLDVPPRDWSGNAPNGSCRNTRDKSTATLPPGLHCRQGSPLSPVPSWFQVSPPCSLRGPTAHLGARPSLGGPRTEGGFFLSEKPPIASQAAQNNSKQEMKYLLLLLCLFSLLARLCVNREKETGRGGEKKRRKGKSTS